jgi:hypothetical protein
MSARAAFDRADLDAPAGYKCLLVQCRLFSMTPYLAALAAAAASSSAFARTP